LHNTIPDVELHTSADTNANPPTGYLAVRDDRRVTDDPPETWDAFWTRTIAATPAVPVLPAPDAAGNTVSYVIRRLCTMVGAPHAANCAKSPTGINTGGSFGAGGVSQITNNQVYYRITTRIAGPRNTVAYIQTIVAL
jgi:type IV pilus assembly protein PilX